MADCRALLLGDVLKPGAIHDADVSLTVARDGTQTENVQCIQNGIVYNGEGL